MAKRTRNLTYNADSFGEAYHVAAAGILDPTAKWRIKNGSETDRQRARRFFEECGLTLTHEVRGSGSAATGIIAREFRRLGGTEAQRLLKERWFPRSLDLTAIRDYAKCRLAQSPGEKILLWNRLRAQYEVGRNTKIELLDKLAMLACESELIPIVIGSPLQESRPWCNLTGLWEVPGLEGYREQLALIRHLLEEYGLLGSIGNKSGAMDGPALLGLPTLYLEGPKSNKKARMEKWLNGVVPGYKREWRDESGMLADEHPTRDWFKSLTTPPI
jgi:hypothetical protein